MSGGFVVMRALIDGEKSVFENLKMSYLLNETEIQQEETQPIFLVKYMDLKKRIT